LSTLVWKQFTARDVVSRWDTVERANWTHTEEFYEVTTAEPTLEAFQAELREWEMVYNTIRPHQSLGQRTPAEYLASLGIDV
jgi:hypothetical protein